MGNGRWEKNFKGVFPRHISGWTNELRSVNKATSLNFCRDRWAPPTLNPPSPAQPSLTPSSPSAQPYLQIWSVEFPSAESPAASPGLEGPDARTMTVGSGRNVDAPGTGAPSPPSSPTHPKLDQTPHTPDTPKALVPMLSWSLRCMDSEMNTQ